MNNSEYYRIPNFQSFIENYESALKDITGELDSIQKEQKTLRSVLKENNEFNEEYRKLIEDNPKYTIEYSYKESDLLENLKAQLKNVTDEKNTALQLWQNATEAVEKLETELRVYQDNTQGFVPRSKLIELRNSYEEKLNTLQNTVTQTKRKLEETINVKSKELDGTLQTHDKSFKIIKNLEDEVLNLQQRLNEANETRRDLEKEVKLKKIEVEALKRNVSECKIKVAEALQIVEAALEEKNASLLREAETKDEFMKLTKAFNEFVDETEKKIKCIKEDYDKQAEQLKNALQTSQDLIKVKEAELENCNKKCSVLEMELEKMKNSKIDDNAVTKILTLEKNLEDTFQKLLLSEKQNIQLKSEVDCVKSDLEQMSHQYERDINVREAEKLALKNQIKKLKDELNDSNVKIKKSEETITDLNKHILTLEEHFKEKIEETKNSFQQACKERQELEAVQNQIIVELQLQLSSQTELNKKWRNETKNITNSLEKVIGELKEANEKHKHENKILHERLKQANVRTLEYRKFLQMISLDVSKITSITVPDFSEPIR